jgi:hypothetical protein
MARAKSDRGGERVAVMARLARDWRALKPEQRLAGAAATALFVAMLLPWYQQNAVVNAPRTAPLQSRNLNAFQAFSFVEAAVMLVAVAVIYLLYARAEGADFKLPGSDGTVVMAAGLWTALLLVVRLFDKPGISSRGVAANVGVQWGIFFALAAAGLLAYAGSRMRGDRRPEPPLRREHPEPRPQPPPRIDRPAPTSRPPSEPASRAQSGQSSYPPAPTAGATQPARRRPVAAVKAAEQLSFEDEPTEPDQRQA